MTQPYEPSPEAILKLAQELRLQVWYSDPQQFARWILDRFVRREKYERVVAHIESSHNEVVCSSTLRHADDGGDPVPLLTCMTWDSHCLRAELRGQRCDGSGWLKGNGYQPGFNHSLMQCPDCPACKPTDNGGRTRESVSEAETPKDGDTAASAGGPAAPINYCPECDGVLGKHVDWCSLAAPASLTPESMSVLEQHCSDADFETIGKMRDESYAAGYSAGRDDAARLNVQEVAHVVKLHEDTVRALVTGLLMAPTRQDATPAVPWTKRAWDLAGTLLAKLKEMKR